MQHQDYPLCVSNTTLLCTQILYMLCVFPPSLPFLLINIISCTSSLHTYVSLHFGLSHSPPPLPSPMPQVFAFPTPVSIPSLPPCYLSFITLHSTFLKISISPLMIPFLAPQSVKTCKYRHIYIIRTFIYGNSAYERKYVAFVFLSLVYLVFIYWFPFSCKCHILFSSMTPTSLYSWTSDLPVSPFKC